MALSKVRQLIVISSAEVQGALKNGRDPRKLAKALGTSMLIDGSVQQAGDELRMTLRILAPDGSIEWGETFEGTSASIFRLQQTMAAALVRAIQARAGIGVQNDFTIPTTTNPNALTMYWRGRSLLDAAASPAQIADAIVAFKEVVKFDPNYSLGYAGLADAYWKQYPGVARRSRCAQRTPVRPAGVTSRSRSAHCACVGGHNLRGAWAVR